MASSKINSEEDATKALINRFRETARLKAHKEYVPHAKQLLFHRSNKRGRVFIGGNRSGKTQGGAKETVDYATGNSNYRKLKFEPPVDLRVVGVDFKQGIEKIIKPAIQRWLPISALKNGSWEDSYSKELRTLTLANKSTIEFMSYEQEVEKFAGTSRHLVWMDEEPPEDIFNENKARLVDTGGDWIITMTPVEGMTWLYDQIYEPVVIDQTDDSIDIIIVDMTENPHLDVESVEEFLNSLSDDDRVARKEGNFVQVGGLIYTELESRHIIKPFTPPKSHLWFSSLDHGYTNPTAWLWGSVDREGRIFIFDEYYETKKLVSENAGAVHAINKRHGKTPEYYVGDPSIKQVNPITGTSVQLEYLDHGVPIVLGNNDQQAGLSRVKGLLHNDKLFITENCFNLINEMKRLRWASYANKKINRERNAKETQNKKNDHACDSLRYGVASRPELFDNGESVPQFNIEGLEVSLSQLYADYDPAFLPSSMKHPLSLYGTPDPHLGAEI